MSRGRRHRRQPPRSGAPARGFPGHSGGRRRVSPEPRSGGEQRRQHSPCQGGEEWGPDRTSFLREGSSADPHREPLAGKPGLRWRPGRAGQAAPRRGRRGGLSGLAGAACQPAWRPRVGPCAPAPLTSVPCSPSSRRPGRGHRLRPLQHQQHQPQDHRGQAVPGPRPQRARLPLRPL